MLINCFNLTMKNISLAMKYLGHNPEYINCIYKGPLFIHLPSPKYILYFWLFKLLSNDCIMRGKLSGWTGI